jgi:hypothetical protein
MHQLEGTVVNGLKRNAWAHPTSRRDATASEAAGPLGEGRVQRSACPGERRKTEANSSSSQTARTKGKQEEEAKFVDNPAFSTANHARRLRQ